MGKEDVPRYKQTKTKNVKKSKEEGGGVTAGEKGKGDNLRGKGDTWGKITIPIPFHCKSQWKG